MIEKILRLLEDFFDSSAFSSLGGITYAYTGQPCETVISKDSIDLSNEMQLEVCLKGDCNI